MPISFRCEKCDQLLRVPDDAAGKKAKCPSCSEVASVPMESTEPPQPAAPMPPPSAGDAFRDPDPANPYSAPTADTTPQMSGYDGPLSQRTIDAGDVLNVAWALFKPNMGILVGATLVIIAVSIVIWLIQQFMMYLMFGVQQPGAPLPPEAAIASMALGIPGQLLQIFLGIGMVRINLAVARGQGPDMGLLFSGSDKFLPILGGSLLLGLLYAAGLVFCIVPGIFVICALWMQYFLVLDQDVKVMDSFSQAWEFSKGNRLAALLLGLIQLGLMILGFIALCIGMVFTLPLAGLLWSVAYLMITGQPIAQTDAA